MQIQNIKGETVLLMAALTGHGLPRHEGTDVGELTASCRVGLSAYNPYSCLEHKDTSKVMESNK